MILEGDTSVIDALKEKKRLMDSGEDSGHIRPLLFVGGGMMQGAYGVGAVEAISKCGYTDVFAYYAGVSCGAASIAYMLSGNVDEGKRVTYEDCCSKDFFDIFRLNNMFSGIAFENALRGHTGKPLEVKEVLKYNDSFYIGATRYSDGESAILHPQNAEELFLYLRASMTQPGVSSERAEIDGVRYVDGACADPSVLEKVIDKTKPTHVLIVANQSRGIKKNKLVESFLFAAVFRSIPARTRNVILTRTDRYMRLLTELTKDSSVPVLVSWGNGSIKPLERDSSIVKNVIEDSKIFWDNVLK